MYCGSPATSSPAHGRCPTAVTRAQDQRRALGLYPDNSTWARATEWPKEDDLSFYLGFHALMTVAGKLIRTRPVYDGDWDEEGSVQRAGCGPSGRPPR